MSAHLSDLNSSEQVVGETLESALELGEKHEVFVQECMKVQYVYVYMYSMRACDSN